MNRTIRLAAVAFFALLTANCMHRYMVAPVIDLRANEVVGIVEFSSTAEGHLSHFTTQKFIEAIIEDQKPVRFIELGDKTQVLAAVAKTQLDPDALKAIAQKYGVRTVLTGELDVSDVHPRVNIGPGFSFASVSANVDATLTARLVEAETGVTIWTGSAREKREVGQIGFYGGKFSFDARDPESAYGGLVHELVRRTTKDFRVTYRWGK